MLVEDSSSDEDEEVVPTAAAASRPGDTDDDDVFVDDSNTVSDDVNVRTGPAQSAGRTGPDRTLAEDMMAAARTVRRR